MVTLSRGWKIFARGLWASHFGSLLVAAEWMYRLNVFARSVGGRHPIIDQIYGLKNALIKYFYQHGYAREVKLHLQKRLCHACDGTGMSWSGNDCWKCDGTGVFAVVRLYAFRFRINGHSFAWHQLEKLIDYPVQLTEAEPSAFVEPLRRDGAILSMADAWLGCCVVWWCLLLHGRKAELLLFESTRNRLKALVKKWTPRLSTTAKRREDDVPF